MALVLAEVETCKKCGVEQGCRILRDTSAHRVDEDPMEDHPSRYKAFFGGSGTDVAVDREGLSGLNDRPSSQFSNAGDIDYTRLPGNKVRRELADHLPDAQRFRPGNALCVRVFGGTYLNLVLACDQSLKNPLTGVVGATDAPRSTADNMNILEIVDKECCLLAGVSKTDKKSGQRRDNGVVIQRDLACWTEAHPLPQGSLGNGVVLRETQ